MKTTIRVPEEYKPLLEDLRELTKDGENPNYMTKRAREGLWKSMQKYGWIYPILVDKKGMLGDGEQRLETCLAHMVMTDPPYNVDYASKTAFMLKIRKGYTRAHIAGDKITDLFAFLCDWLEAMKNYLTDYNSIYITFAPGNNLRELFNAINTCGYYHSQTLIWNKNAPVLGRSDYRYKHEPIVVCWWGKHKFYGKRERTVWDIPKPHQSKLHPTMKPVELCARAIGNSSLPGEIVLDPFAGSGSTLIACEQLDRKGYMIELDPRYCQIILDRYEAYTGEVAEKI